MPQDRKQQSKMVTSANLNEELPNEEFEESSRMREQIAKLRKELDIETTRARQLEKDHACELHKFQHVIERLVNELEMITRAWREQAALHPVEPAGQLGSPSSLLFKPSIALTFLLQLIQKARESSGGASRSRRISYVIIVKRVGA